LRAFKSSFCSQNSSRIEVILPRVYTAGRLATGWYVQRCTYH
jgi:hypothetical protein